MALGIPAQGVIGGITVLTQLNPYVVGAAPAAVDGADLAGGLAGAADPATGAAPVPPPSPLLPRRHPGAAVGGRVARHRAHRQRAARRRRGVPPQRAGRRAAHPPARGAVYAAVAGTLVCVVLLRSRAALLLLASRCVQAGDRDHPVPPRPADRAGRPAPARRLPGHRRRHQPDAVGPSGRGRTAPPPLDQAVDAAGCRCAGRPARAAAPRPDRVRRPAPRRTR